MQPERGDTNIGYPRALYCYTNLSLVLLSPLVGASNPHRNSEHDIQHPRNA